MKPNQDIRKLIRDSNVCSWQVAEELGIGENTFYRMLRKKLTEMDRQRILTAVETIKTQLFGSKEESRTV